MSNLGNQSAHGNTWDTVGGLTKREYIAARLMASLIISQPSGGPMALTTLALVFTDALLSQLESDANARNRLNGHCHHEPIPESELPF